MPPPPPELMEELVEEILLRLPPAKPASLLRAALVCRLWCRLVTGAAFRRRFREFHRTPPMLGFLCDLHREKDDDEEENSVEGVFVPTTSSFRPPLHQPFSGWQVCDSRHGRVLLQTTYVFSKIYRPNVWKPITDDWMWLPTTMRLMDDPDSWTAAVLCAAAGTGACDHLDCHDGPFIVVLMVTDKLDPKGMFSYVYSSESRKWSEPTTAKHPGDCISSKNRSALVGNTLYFIFEKNDKILKYDLKTWGMSPVELPCYTGANLISKPFVELMTTEDGRLGFARLEESKLCLWSRDNEDVGWALKKVIELEKLLPFDVLLAYHTHLVGFAEGVNVIFVCVGERVFTVDLKGGKVMKVYEGSITYVVPYMSFCTPALRAASTCASIVLSKSRLGSN